LIPTRKNSVVGSKAGAAASEMLNGSALAALGGS
jgi:hypothetical protein